MSDMMAKIKKDSITFRKEKSPLAPTSIHLISTITSYAKDNNGGEITDEIVVRCVRSLIKKQEDLIKMVSDKKDTTEEVTELKFLNRYTPPEVSESVISEAVSKFFETEEKTMKNMGKAMAALKSNFGDSLNPATASKIVKDYINA